MRQFNGTIADKKLSDFNQYDNKLTKCKDRIDFVKGNLYVGEVIHEFFSTYFSQYYSSNPSQDGYLAEDDAVCRLLDILGTYILSANDVESNRKVEYRFWKSEREYRDYKDAQNISASTSEDGVEVVDMFVNKNDKNQKVIRPISINSKDVKEIVEVRQLEDAIDYLKSPAGMKAMREHVFNLLESDVCSGEEKDRLKYIHKNTERYINKYVKSLRENQVMIKKAIKKPIEFKSVLKDEGVPNKLDIIDFMEANDIIELLPYLHEDDLMSDLGTIIFDLKALIKVTKLSNREQEIINMFCKGFKQIEIAEALDIKKQNVKTYMKRISVKVSKTYEKQVESHRELIRQKKVN